MRNQTEKMTRPTAPPIRLRIERGAADKSDYRFTQPFRCGRDKSCEVRLTDTAVSRFHAEFWFSDGKWRVLDLQSANGTYVDGRRVDRAPISTRTKVELGEYGPLLTLTVEEDSKDETPQIEQRSLDHYQQYYLQDNDAGDAGRRTLMIRQAFKNIQKRQKRKFTAVIAALLCLFIAAGSYALYKHLQVRKQKLLAADIFYTMKSMELEFAPLVKMAELSQDSQLLAQVKQYRARRKVMQNKYDKFIEALEIYNKSISAEERLILRIARTFGECEIKTPPGFVKEVLKYIEKWKSTSRLKRAILRARENGYTAKIAESLLAHDLPPQFFYLALQESGFNINACGPETRWGIAKGMWQFIPSTAVFYGLRTGPLQHLRRPDPRDERHDFEKSTNAAAKYLKTIYDTEAQASGLLVMASYNWGERRVIRLIKTMPENPQERNFWLLLEKYKNKIPRETYDYVFYIFSAAVIGEDPDLFGFDFENPLAYLKTPS
jgi:hypothetical protein